MDSSHDPSPNSAKAASLTSPWPSKEAAKSNPQSSTRRRMDTPRDSFPDSVKALPPTRPEPSKEAVKETYKRKFGLGIFIGKFDEAYTKTQEYRNFVHTSMAVICVATTLPLYHMVLQPSWANGAQAFTLGTLYVMLPWDLIADGTKWFGYPVGWLDDVLFGGVPIAVGMYAMFEAYKTDSDPSLWLGPFFAFSLLLALLALLNKRGIACARTICLGVFTMVSQAVFMWRMLPSLPQAAGVSLYAVYFLNNLLSISSASCKEADEDDAKSSPK